jgi:hypothetical protein
VWEEATGVEVGLRDGEVLPCPILNDGCHLRVTDPSSSMFPPTPHKPHPKLQTLGPPWPHEAGGDSIMILNSFPSNRMFQRQ